MKVKYVEFVKAFTVIGTRCAGALTIVAGPKYDVQEIIAVPEGIVLRIQGASGIEQMALVPSANVSVIVYEPGAVKENNESGPSKAA